MIAVDTSALMAIVQEEPKADACMSAIEVAGRLIISAGAVAEAMIVAQQRSLREEMSLLISHLGLEIIPVTAETADRIGEAFLRWGKGFHPAALNLGDCFAYEAATTHQCPLLYMRP